MTHPETSSPQHYSVRIDRITVWPLVVEVTEKHIANGLRPSQKIDTCPVSIALRDHGLSMSDIKLTDEAKKIVFEFMEDFDKCRDVAPFEFTAQAAEARN